MQSRKRKVFEKVVLYIILCFMTLLTIGPFVLLVSTAMKGPTENLMKFPPDIIPLGPTFGNFTKVFETIPIFSYMLNSAIVAVSVILLQLLISSMAAYPLARMEFKGKKIIFLLIISTMFLPGEVTLIPVYSILVRILHLKNNLLSVIIPAAVGAFGVFLMKQAFLSVPREIEESAIIDGCGSMRIFIKIMLPLVKPSLGTLAIFTFIASWNSFLFPLLLLEKSEIYTLPIGLLNLQGTFSTDMRLVAAGSTLALIPILIVFMSLQRYFVGGLTAGAVKG